MPSNTERIRILYKTNTKNTLYLPPAGEIQAEAFAGDRNIQCVVVDSATRIIGDRAFADCLSMYSIMIPRTVTSISRTAFEGCPNLTLFVPGNSPAMEFAQQYGLAYINVDDIQ